MFHSQISPLFANHYFLLYRDMPEIIFCKKKKITEGHYYYLVYLLYVTNVKQDLFFCLGSKGQRSFVLPEGSSFSHQ